MVRCVAVGCDNDQRSSEGVSFYRLPKNKELQKKWKNAIKRDRLAKDTRLCHVHFDDNSFQRDLKVKSFIKMILHIFHPFQTRIIIVFFSHIYSSRQNVQQNFDFQNLIYVYKIVNLFSLFQTFSPIILFFFF